MMTSAKTTIDYSGYGQTEVSGGDLELLAGLAERQLDLETLISAKEAELKDLQAAHREISWQQLPELLESLNMESFKLRDGSSITIKEDLRLSIPKTADRRTEALGWLLANGGEFLFKEAFQVQFDKGEGDAAEDFAKFVESYAGRLNLSRSETVDTGSVKTFVRAKLENGEEVPLALLGGHRQTIAKIKEGKKR